jgi:type II restriction/modification system DNA methylase subunit YeeA
MDAILDLSDPKHPKEPEWPAAEFIVGNPPFLGTKKLRAALGDSYVEQLFALYGDRIPNFSDLCCYWFEKAQSQIKARGCKRAGLLATQGIRGGLNREVLKRIKESGEIFFAESDRDWVLDGANVHVSMVGFDSGEESNRVLDGRKVPQINSNLSSVADITQALKLAKNRAICFYADVKAGKFEITSEEARSLLCSPNPNGLPSSDALRTWANGLDLLRRPSDTWIIDFGSEMSLDEAAMYEGPFGVVRTRVKPLRDATKRKSYRDYWWIHAEPCSEMRRQIEPLERYLATVAVSKHRIFVWMPPPTLPDHALMVFARSDDFTFGVLHSRLHEVWALKLGTRLETRPRYTPTTCFETFPFPEPADEQKAMIAATAKELDTLRSSWLNPPEWTRQEVLEFPGSVKGPWARYVHDADSRGIGTVRYPRLVPKDDDCAARLAKRTLTNLYNERPTWLDLAHKKLDAPVFAAYGWKPDMSDDDILSALLALNLERAKGPKVAHSTIGV